MLAERALFVGAHADDIELFAGATLSRLAREGRDVRCVVFSTHRGVSDHEAARDECRRSLAEVYGLPEHAFFIGDLGACDGEFQTLRDRIYARLAELRDGWRPGCVVTHSPRDTNQDHQQVAAEAIRVFKGAATLLHGEFLNNDLGDQAKRIFVEVEERDVERKVRALELYRSQQINARRYFEPELVHAQARVLGNQVGARFAEVFSASRVIVRL